MRNHILRGPAAALLLTAFAAGCIYSVDAVVPPTAAAFDQQLLGAWAGADGERALITTGDAPGEYAIAYTQKDTTSHYAARLGRLGTRLVLDVWPAPRDPVVRAYGDMLLPAHLVFVVNLSRDSLTTALLEGEPLKAQIDSGRLKLTALASRDRLVLTSPTAELRTALSAYLASDRSIDEPTTWRRVR